MRRLLPASHFAAVGRSSVMTGIPQSIAQGGRIALLQVFEVQPSPAAPLALNDSLVLYFNRRVDCRDAEAAFSVTPAIRGRAAMRPIQLEFHALRRV